MLAAQGQEPERPKALTPARSAFVRVVCSERRRHNAFEVGGIERLIDIRECAKLYDGHGSAGFTRGKVLGRLVGPTGHAWGYRRRAEAVLGAPLTATRQGKGASRGTALTSTGRLVIAQLLDVRRRLDGVVGADRANGPRRTSPARRRVFCLTRSHPVDSAGLDGVD
jgi:hypothetical protein